LPDSFWGLFGRALVPKRWRQKFLNKTLYQGYRGIEGLGLPLAPNRTDRKGSSAPVRGRGLIDAIHADEVKPTTGLAQFHECDVELMDGSRHRVDVVVLCTGYRPTLEYLDIRYESDVDGWPRRISDDIEGGYTQVLGYPGLYLVGRFYRGLGPLYNIRREARTAVGEIEQRLADLRRQTSAR
jgi:hypothetical protein